jgi:hypothetical protein
VQRCFFDTHAVGAADRVIHTDTLQGEGERGREGRRDERGMKWEANGGREGEE